MHANTSANPNRPSGSDTVSAVSDFGRSAAAVLAGGIVGTLAVFIAVNGLLGVPFAALFARPGKFVVAVLIAATFPLIFRKLPAVSATLLAVAFAMIVPTVLANTAFVGAAPTPWPTLLGFNAIFALVATATFQAVCASRNVGAN